jgi:hypothetical protein
MRAELTAEDPFLPSARSRLGPRFDWNYPVDDSRAFGGHQHSNSVWLRGHFEKMVFV